MSKARADYDNVVITPNPMLGILNDDFDSGVTDRWTEVEGQWDISFDNVTGDGAYQQTSVAGGARTVTGVSTGDQVVQVNARALSFGATDAWFGLMARYVDNSNYYYVTLRNNGTLSLRKLVNGNIVVLKTTSLPVTAGSWYNVRLDAIGNALRVYVDGEHYLEARDTSYPRGRYGLVTSRAAAEFDDLLVSQP
jgi:3-keto-disaccharide hydrolase